MAARRDRPRLPREEFDRLLGRQRFDNGERDAVISNLLAGRIAAALYALCGILTIATGYLGHLPGASQLGVALVGLTAIGIGSVVWLLPWERWPRSRIAWVVPPSFILVVLINIFSADEPFRFGLLFVVIFLWIGLIYSWRGLTLAIAPFLIAFLLPLSIAGQLTSVTITSAGFVLAICLLVGGTVAWVTRLLQLAHAELRQREERFSLLLQHASDLIAILDRHGTILYMGASIERTMGYRPDTLVGTGVLQRVHPDDAGRVEAALTACLQTSGSLAPVPVRYQHADASWRQLEVVVTNQLDYPAIRGVVLNARDVTERVEAQEQLAWQARHDYLTGLANRAAFASRAETALRDRAPDEALAVLFIDLDNFKQVNDQLGHSAGDQLLKAVAGRLRATLRPAAVVARQGGDEFTILLTGNELGSEATQVAERLLATFAAPFALDGFEIVSGASVGIAVSNEPAIDVSDLLQQADTALYEAKRQGKGRFIAFEPWMRACQDQPNDTRTTDTGDRSTGAAPDACQPHLGPDISSTQLPRIRPLPAT